MAGVIINSGLVVAEDMPRDVPREKWSDLILARKRFCTVKLSYDCRCLAQFVRDAEEMWEPLGYADADDLIRRGLDLEPEEVRLVARWLELNDPEEAIGMNEVIARTTSERNNIAAANTTGEVLPRGQVNQHTAAELVAQIALPQPQRAAGAGVSRRQQQKLDDLARQAPLLLAAVRRKEISVHRACVQAGIVKERTNLEWLEHWWAKASLEDRQRFIDAHKE